MGLSIRTRMIVGMNLPVIAVGVLVGWWGIEIAGRAVERRLVDNAVANAAGVVGEMRLPASDTLMARLGRIFGAEAVIGPSDKPHVMGSSLPPAATRQLQNLLAAGPLPRKLDLAGRAYDVGQAAVHPPKSSPIEPQAPPLVLYLLVPRESILAARSEVATTISLITLAAIAGVTLLGCWISASISRPVRRLARQMDALATQQLAGGPPAGELVHASQPAEIVQLADSFHTLQERLALAMEQLSRSARLATLGEMSASIVHELRNPLSGIKMNAKILADELAAKGMQDPSLAVIIREIDRMEFYLQELLEAHRGERPLTPTPPADHEPLDLQEQAESVLALLAGRCTHGRMKVSLHFDPRRPLVMGAQHELRRVILNLVLNAMQAMPQGGQLGVGTELRGDVVRLWVSDSGPGVQAPAGKDIFEPFVTTKTGGAGLGLYICRQIIQAHHGRIEYDTTDKGATFWLELPAGGPVVN